VSTAAFRSEPKAARNAGRKLVHVSLRLYNAALLWQQRRADRRLPIPSVGCLTDEVERRMMEQLICDRSFRP
jgi:hypothetical protein